MESKYTQMRDILLKNVSGVGNYQSPLHNIRIVKRDAPTEFLRCLYYSTCILVLQGEKNIYYGSNKLVYGKGQYVISCTDIPVLSRITEASYDNPLVILMLEFDSYLISHIALESNIQTSPDINHQCLAVANIDEDLLDAFYRLIQLMERPEAEKEIVYPLIIKEIYYRLLVGPLGYQLYLVNKQGTRYSQIVQAISLLKERYREKLHIEEIADYVNMSLSSFYRVFKQVTRVSPLQYQKQLRLYEAQRLLLTGEYSIESASYAVGYESPTQFSREYKKMFGFPPRTHINSIADVSCVL